MVCTAAAMKLVTHFVLGHWARCICPGPGGEGVWLQQQHTHLLSLQGKCYNIIDSGWAPVLNWLGV